MHGEEAKFIYLSMKEVMKYQIRLKSIELFHQYHLT